MFGQIITKQLNRTEFRQYLVLVPFELCTAKSLGNRNCNRMPRHRSACDLDIVDESCLGLDLCTL